MANSLFSHRKVRFVLIILVLGTIACNLPFRKKDGDMLVDQPGSATRLPAVDVSSLPPTSPRLIASQPAPGEELPLDGSIDLYFDQPMNTSSVEKAVAVSPQVSHSLQWIDDSTLRIVPGSGALDRAKRYTVTVGEGATSADGLRMESSIEVDIQTVGFLEVGEVLPADGSQAVETNSVITVFFNRPVVPLTLVSDPQDQPHPLTFSPEIPGQGEWVNTSIYIWTPDQPLKGSTTYNVAIAAGLTDQTGGVLQDHYTWSFTTLPPSIVNVSPTDGEGGLPLDAVVRVEFNQPMDRSSTQAAFSLVDENTGQAIAGSFEWDETGRQMTFTPQRLLPLGARLEASVTTGAQGVSGGAFLQGSLQWRFWVAPAPAVISTRPQNGNNNVESGGFDIIFASEMDEESVADHLTVSPALPEKINTYSGPDWDSYDMHYWRFSLSAWLEPSTTYTVTLEPGAVDPYGNVITEPYTFSFTTKRLDPMVELNTSGIYGLYDANRPTELFAIYRNVEYFNLQLAELDIREFGRLANSYEVLNSFRPAASQVIREWRIETDAGLNETAYSNIDITEQEGGTLQPGIYMLIVDAPGIQGDIKHFMIISEVNLTFKMGFEQAFVWLTDLKTGQPIENKGVTFYNENFGIIGQGVTGKDGTLSVDIQQQRELRDSYYAVVEGQDIFAIAALDWGAGVSPWDFGVSGQFSFVDNSVYIYTDRPLYRPGQEVFYKAVVRAKNDTTFTVPPYTQVQVNIFNDQGEQIMQRDATLTDYGTLNGSIQLDEGASLGYYSIEIKHGGDVLARRGFQVAAYAKPEFQITVEPRKSAVLEGDTIDVEVDATFFFGGPVSDADVQWSVLSGGYSFQYDGPGWYAFSDPDFRYGFYDDSYIPGYGNLIEDGSGKTDANGKFTITLPASLDDEGGSRRLTIEAVVTDINDRSVAGRTEVIVHKGRYYAGVQSQEYVVSAGDKASADIIVVDWNSQPAADRDVTVQLVELNWNNVQEEDEFGRTQWVWTLEQNPVGDPVTVTTDKKGEASVKLTPPEGGNYKIRATVADDNGNKNSGSDFIWVTSRQFVVWRQTNNDRFDLVLDKGEYKPGDTAEILIASPFAGDDVQALITVERAGVMSYEVVTLDSNSYVYRLPITGQHAPNVFVSVILVKGVDETNRVPAFKMGQAKLTVAPVEQTLNVTVTPNKDEVGPGDEVTYTIKTEDHNGKPVDAEVSLALVDLAVLTLSQPNSGPIVDHFYGNEGLGVRTAIPLIYLVDRYNQELFDQGKGGGGGGGEGFFDIRGDFRDTAYWSAVVRTGEKGQTRVSITLPDNLTTWRMDARAVTNNTLVGQTTVDIVSTKPLLIRPVTPRFFIIRDELTLAAVVNNNTDKEVDASVTLEANGIVINGEKTQVVTIPANGQVKVEWDVVVDADVESVDMVFSVRAGQLQDASRPPLGDPDNGQQIPVYRYEMPETVGTAGQLPSAGERLEGVALPPTYDISQGELMVQINPSLAAATLDSLRWLRHYQYECAEQVVSRFMPNAYTLQTLRRFNLSDDELERNLITQINIGLQKLYALQHVDGGWGWFVNNDSDLTVSTYAVQGLLVAQEAGMQVDPGVLERGLSYLNRQLVPLDSLDDQYVMNRQAYVLYVLAVAGQPEASYTTQLYDSRESLQYWSRALLAQTLWRIDPADPRLGNIKSDLVNGAILSGTGAYWEENSDDVLNWNTDTRTTAIVLDTFALLWPDNELAPNAVRWLMVARSADHWTTTQETVWAILGLTDWMAATGELNADYKWTFTFNGLELAEGEATAETVRDSHSITINVLDLLTDHVNRLAFSRDDGPGRMYYTAHLTAYLPVEEVDPLSRGVVISRRYLDADDTPVVEGRVGDVVTAEVTIIAPHGLNYFVAEDYYPAGAEPVDTSLETESVLAERPSLRQDNPLYRGWGWWWFSNIDLRDEKAVLYADWLSQGTYQFRYQIRLGLPGVYRVIPPVAWEFYFPEVYGRGEGMLFTIKE